jgi:hypothetical protein
MHKLKMGLAVFATSMAVFISVGSASALAVDVDVCRWDHTECVVVPDTMAITDVNVCGIRVGDIPALMSGQWVSCIKPGRMARIH